MSVIAIRDGIIAADTGASLGGIMFKVTKLVRQGDIAIGFSGHHSDGMIFSKWYFDGADMDNLPTFHNRKDQDIDFTAIVLNQDGWEYWYEWFYRDLDLQKNEFFAIGNGAEVAMGAMHMGATAVGAVEAACKLIKGCELPVESEQIGGKIQAVENKTVPWIP